jgi:hypothetical protein
MRRLFCEFPAGGNLFLPSFPRTREPSVFAVRSLSPAFPLGQPTKMLRFSVRDGARAKHVSFFALVREWLFFERKAYFLDSRRRRSPIGPASPFAPQAALYTKENNSRTSAKRMTGFTGMPRSINSDEGWAEKPSTDQTSLQTCCAFQSSLHVVRRLIIWTRQAMSRMTCGAAPELPIQHMSDRL